MRLELDITGTYGSGVTYEDDIVPANIKQRVDDLQEDIFNLESEIDDVQDVFNNNMKEKADVNVIMFSKEIFQFPRKISSKNFKSNSTSNFYQGE